MNSYIVLSLKSHPMWWYIIGVVVVILIVWWLAKRGKKGGSMGMGSPMQPGQPQM